MAKDIFGNSLYQKRARRALPILVRQALSEQPITYEDLAKELGMTNPRNLNYPLGSIGVTLQGLGKKEQWKRNPPPPIQALVINKARRTPGHGIEGFLKGLKVRYSELTAKEKRQWTRVYWEQIYAYPYWHRVLEELQLKPSNPVSTARLIKQAATHGGGGEGPAHQRLKKFVEKYPEKFGLEGESVTGSLESSLPSGDRVDVLFEGQSIKAALEVKSEVSNDKDIVRGLFQCVKYRAVLEADRGINSCTYNVKAALVIGRPLPSNIRAIRNGLGVSVYEVKGRLGPSTKVRVHS